MFCNDIFLSFANFANSFLSLIHDFLLFLIFQNYYHLQRPGLNASLSRKPVKISIKFPFFLYMFLSSCFTLILYITVIFFLHPASSFNYILLKSRKHILFILYSRNRFWIKLMQETVDLHSLLAGSLTSGSQSYIYIYIYKHVCTSMCFICI